MIYKDIKFISTHARLYGMKSSHSFECMVKGYYMCYHINNVKMNKEMKSFLGFSEFIQKKYQMTSTQDWGRIIRFFSKSNVDSIERFRELFFEYIEGVKSPKDNSYYENIIVKIKDVSDFNEMIEVIIINKEHYQLDSMRDIENLIDGYATAAYYLNKVFDNKYDEVFFNFYNIRLTIFIEFICKKLMIKPFNNYTSNYRNILLTNSVPPLSSTPDEFLKYFKEFNTKKRRR